MKYAIVEESTSARLADLVNIYIRDGWEPLGGVTVMFGSGWKLYTQALIKRPIQAPV